MAHENSLPTLSPIYVNGVWNYSVFGSCISVNFLHHKYLGIDFTYFLRYSLISFFLAIWPYFDNGINFHSICLGMQRRCYYLDIPPLDPKSNWNLEQKRYSRARPLLEKNCFFLHFELFDRMLRDYDPDQRIYNIWDSFRTLRTCYR